MASIQEILQAKKPMTVDTQIVLDPDKARALKAARAEVEKLEKLIDMMGDDPVPKFVTELEATQKHLEDLDDGEAVATFKFKALSRVDFQRLLDAHPLGKEERAQLMGRGVKRPDLPIWSLETFPPALLAATAVDPDLTIEEATSLWNADTFSSSELDLLFSSAMVAQQSPEVQEAFAAGKG